MEEHRLTSEKIQAYDHWLRHEERASGTIEKYLRDIRAFAACLDGKAVTRETVAEWKEDLLSRHYAPSSINATLAALNGLFHFLGWDDCRTRFLKVQRRMFRDSSRELTRSDYDALIATARGRGQERLALLMETICATGIRVSEVRYITVEAVRQGQTEIALKGKIRTIILPSRLCRKLRKYAAKQKIVSGELFLTRNGKPLSRRQIWAEMKRLCKYAHVDPAKVFPHNLRHLFATTFYHTCRDVVKLEDVLGHSSIETTRIYLLTSGTEHRRQLDRLGLAS